MSETVEGISVENARGKETWDLGGLSFLKQHFELLLVSTLLIVVAAVAYALADRMSLPADVKKSILIAASLQDVGKRGVWHHILNRRGGLSDHERKELEGHVEESVSIAKRMGYDHPQVLEIIATHHELLNGEGYPHRMKGGDIPLAGRISGVADVYCALTAWRSFRDPWDSRVALGELRKGVASGMYDAKVVETLCEPMS